MSENRTEQPTPRRLENARKDGNFAPAGMAIPAVQLAAYMILLSFGAPLIAAELGRMLKTLLRAAFDPGALVNAFPLFVPVLTAGAKALLPPALMVTALSMAIQLVLTGFGVSAGRVTPQWKRLNPIPRLGQMPKNSLFAALEAVVLISAAAYVGWGFYGDPALLRLLEGDHSLRAASLTAWELLEKMLSKAAWLALIYGVGNFMRQRYEWANSLMMTKEEIKRESKESEGNPQIKMRIRKIQRDFLRRRMMDDVAKATAVIVNPTHYAVALRYDMEIGGAPRVLAKGRNYMAFRIRLKAIQNQIPIVENPPLAQALYQAADIGQEIPAHLYRAVAEVLAYIYRIMNGRLAA